MPPAFAGAKHVGRDDREILRAARAQAQGGVLCHFLNASFLVWT
jgi:hypothetical protein